MRQSHDAGAGETGLPDDPKTLADPAGAGARAATLALLATRAAGGTVCPSEVARALTSLDTALEASDWRRFMPLVHATVDRLVAEGLVQLSWKGEVLETRAGPYRIGRPSPYRRPHEDEGP